MAYVMTNKQFIEKLELALNSKTAYMWGTFGQPISNDLIKNKVNQYPGNYTTKRINYLKSLVPQEYFAFDCVGLIKGCLWSWSADHSKSRGGAGYETNGVPDTNVNGFRKLCTNMSNDFSKIEKGELVFMPGHIGVYVGDGECIESTLGNYGDGVVKTKLEGRGWNEHGKCQFIEYIPEVQPAPVPSQQIFLYVNSIGLNVRDSLSFKNGKTNAKWVAFCPIGDSMEVLEFIPGIQKDGYQWLKVKYKDKQGYSQLDSACYYLYTK